MVAEDLGHRGQDAGPVGHVHAQVEGGAHVVLRAHRRAGALRGRRRRAGKQVARGVDQVAQHGAGGRPTAGATPVEHQLAADRALDEHGVERAAHRRQRVRLGDHGRVHPDGDLRAAVDELGDREELDGVAEPAGVGDVGRADAADALAVHVGVDDVGPESECGQDGGLGGGVVPLDVRRRVALGQAELLRLAQDVVVAVAMLLHAGEDVVGRPVHDPHHAEDLLARQRLAQRPDDGDGAGHRRLVEQVHAGRGRHFGQLGAGSGQERLVAGDHGLAVAQRGLDQLVGGMEAADQLDHDVDVGAADERGGVGADEARVDRRGTGLVGVGHRDPDQLEPDARTGRHVIGAGEEYLGQGARRRCRTRAGPRARSAPGVRAGGRGHSCGRWPCRQSPPNGTGCSRRHSDLFRRGRAQASRRVRSSSVSRRTATRAVPSETKTTAGRGTLL